MKASEFIVSRFFGCYLYLYSICTSTLIGIFKYYLMAPFKKKSLQTITLAFHWSSGNMKMAYQEIA